MLSLIFAASLVIVGQPGPAEVHAAALGDLVQRVPPETQYDTRYVSLHSAAPGPARDSLYAALVFALNSTSFRATLAQPVRLRTDGTLVRISLAALSWDVAARTARIERLKGQGVDVSTFKPDLWEEIVQGEPYFFATYAAPDGKITRGWVDPNVDYRLRLKTYSTRAIVRADWLIARLLREKENQGVYSQSLLHSNKEADLYRTLGVDEKLLDADLTLRNGGAVFDSPVALHARELQFIRQLYGWDEAILARTFDFASDALGDQSVVETLNGKVRHDGREIIYTLPNGLHAYYLADGKGNQVAVVPQNIAIDQTQGINPIKDRSVVNAYTCIRCHGPASGWQPFHDVIGDALLNPAMGLAAFSYYKDRIGQLGAEVTDYYLSDLQKKIRRRNVSYAERLKLTNGLAPAENAEAINRTVEGYIYDLVTPEQAAREQGQPLDVARIQWKAAADPYAKFLYGGYAVRRAAFERAFPEIMRSNIYPWEGAKKP
jgi:hypothetical protein